MRKKHVTWWRRLPHSRELASVTMSIYFILFKPRKYIEHILWGLLNGGIQNSTPLFIGLTLRLKLLKFIRLQLRCWFGTLWKELAKSPSCSGSCENLRGDMWYQWRWGHHHMWLHRCVEVLEDLGIEDCDVFFLLDSALKVSPRATSSLSLGQVFEMKSFGLKL